MNRNSLVLLIAITLIIPVISSADIWEHYVNSNHCDQLLGNDHELWVQTEGGGLTRWDLATMQPARYYDTAGLPSSDINGITYDNEGKLIALESQKKFYRFDDGTFKLFANTDIDVQSFVFSKTGLLISQSPYTNKGIYRWDGSRWIAIPELSDYNVYYMVVDKKGDLWAYSLNTVRLFVHDVDGQLTTYSWEEVTGEPDNIDLMRECHGIDLDNTGVIWVKFRGGVAWFDGNEWKRHFWIENPTLTTPYIHSVIRDADGIVWVAAGKDTLLRYDGESWTFVKEYENTEVLSLSSASDGKLWIGTSEGLEHFDGIERKSYSIENLMPVSNLISALDISSDGDLWCGDLYGDLASLHRSTWKKFHGSQITSTDFKHPGGLNVLKVSKSKGIWAGFLWDLLRYDGNLWISYRSDLVDIMGYNFTIICESENGDIWVGTDNGYAKFDGESWTTDYPEGILNEHIPFRSMTSDIYGNLWVISSYVLMVKSDDGWKIIDLYLDYPEYYQCYAKTVTAMSDGTVWVGGNYGIIVLSDLLPVKYFTADDGIPEDPNNDNMISISSIKQSPDGSIWILNPYGLTNYDGVNFKVYKPDFWGDDLWSNQMAIDSSGRIFLSSVLGLFEFTPSSLTLKMSLFADQIMYKAGDKLNISLMVNNYGPDETGDLYFVMLAPDGNFYSGLDWSRGLHPAASNLTIPANFSLPVTKLLNLTLPSTTPSISQPGKYYFAIALADTGTTYLRSKAIITVNVP
jgi:streptogramin lyase